MIGRKACIHQVTLSPLESLDGEVDRRWSRVWYLYFIRSKSGWRWSGHAYTWLLEGELFQKIWPSMASHSSCTYTRTAQRVNRRAWFKARLKWLQVIFRAVFSKADTIVNLTKFNRGHAGEEQMVFKEFKGRVLKVLDCKMQRHTNARIRMWLPTILLLAGVWLQ